jgi:hypothetical protein
MTMTADERVAQGMELLDRRVDGWWLGGRDDETDFDGSIELGLLDVSDGSRCVLAQLHRTGDYHTASTILWPMAFGESFGKWDARRAELAIAHGLLSAERAACAGQPPEGPCWAEADRADGELTAAWRAAIAARRGVR